MTTHYFMWRAPREDEHLTSERELIPFVWCGAKYSSWSQLVPEKDWKRITCSKCRKEGRRMWALIKRIERLKADNERRLGRD